MAEGRGAKRGARPAIDWEQAFAYYASLAPLERSYAAVAAQFGISARTVETHGRNEDWKERLRQIKEETRTRTAESLIEARIAEIEKLRKLIDGTFVGYAEALRNGMRMSPADLERLNRLSLALKEEVISPQPPWQDDEPEASERTPEHVSAVIDALAESGALEALGLTKRPPAQTEPTHKEEEEEG